jgi:putative transposase
MSTRAYKSNRNVSYACTYQVVWCPKYRRKVLIECDPQFGIHRLVRLIKGRSSRFLRQEFPVLRRKLPTLWTNSYFVSTVGDAPLSVIKQYIENQKHV